MGVLILQAVLLLYPFTWLVSYMIRANVPIFAYVHLAGCLIIVWAIGENVGGKYGS